MNGQEAAAFWARIDVRSPAGCWPVKEIRLTPHGRPAPREAKRAARSRGVVARA